MVWVFFDKNDVKINLIFICLMFNNVISIYSSSYNNG